MIGDPHLGMSPSDASHELNILRHYGHMLGMDSADICVLNQANEIGFHSLLQGHNHWALELLVHFKVLDYLLDQIRRAVFFWKWHISHRVLLLNWHLFFGLSAENPAVDMAVALDQAIAESLAPLKLNLVGWNPLWWPMCFTFSPFHCSISASFCFCSAFFSFAIASCCWKCSCTSLSAFSPLSSTYSKEKISRVIGTWASCSQPLTYIPPALLLSSLLLPLALLAQGLLQVWPSRTVFLKGLLGCLSLLFASVLLFVRNLCCTPSASCSSSIKVSS